MVSGSGDSVELTVVRNQKSLNYTVDPYYDKESGEYKLGLWIKEKIAGIGTLTFYDPKTNKFASLGHGIYESETGALLKAKSGTLLNTRVDQIKAGEKGEPGELGGVIYDFQNPLGTIEKNTEFGIYGEADDAQDFALSKPLLLAARSEMERETRTSDYLDGTKVEKFHIEITKVRHQGQRRAKGLEFEVTDENLLKRCGGIVQGMSGSPIIQNNRLVGAVTHVFINNPKKGYGIFAEFMVEECEK